LPGTASGLKRVTEPGQHVLESIELILREVGNLKRIGEQFSAKTAAPCPLPPPTPRRATCCPNRWPHCASAYPKVNISLHQGAPDQVARMLIDEVAEIGIATESLAAYAELVTLPCYEWQHMLVLPSEHPLAQQGAHAAWKTWRKSR